MHGFFYMNKKDLKKIGEITREHGYKGKVVLSISPDLNAILNKTITIWIEEMGLMTPYKLTNIQELKKNKFILELLNVKHEKSQKLIRKKVYVDPTEFPEDNDHFINDEKIVNYKIFDQEKKYIGVVSDHIHLPNNELIQTYIDEKEVLIPFHKETTIQIDQISKEIHINIPEGLLAIYLDEK